MHQKLAKLVKCVGTFMPAPPSLALRIQIVFLEAASVEKVKILNFCNPPARKTGGFFVADLPSNNKKQGECAKHFLVVECGTWLRNHLKKSNGRVGG